MWRQANQVKTQNGSVPLTRHSQTDEPIAQLLLLIRFGGAAGCLDAHFTELAV